jgi:REP element-mobilizing transposase RayT
MPERLRILQHIRAGDPKYYDLSGAVVMPDHVHLLLKPAPGIDLPRILRGIKGVSAKLVNDMRSRRSRIWQDESYDRIIRNADEFQEKMNYIAHNPARRDLCDASGGYPALYVSLHGDR